MQAGNSDLIFTMNLLTADWTLGAVLYENELDLTHSCRRQQQMPQSEPVRAAESNSATPTVNARWFTAVAVTTAFVLATQQTSHMVHYGR